MGMGYGSNYADTVDEAFVKETCHAEFYRLKLAIKQEEYYDSLYDLAQETNNGEELTGEAVIKAYKELCESFKDKTGLSLGLGFHSQEDDGDRYDDVDGHYWWVEDVYVLSPAAEKMGDKIKRKFYVTFG